MKGYGPDDGAQSPRVAGSHHVPASAARHSVRPAWTSPSSGCPSTPGSPCARAPASGPEPSARPRSPSGRPTTRRSASPCSSASRWSTPATRAWSPASPTAASTRWRRRSQQVHAAGGVPLGIGGDHTVTLAELRAAAQRPRPARPGALRRAHGLPGGRASAQRYIHGTVVRRAVEEGLVDPALLDRSSACAAASTRPDEYDAGARARLHAWCRGTTSPSSAPAWWPRRSRRSASARPSSASTSTSWTRASRPAVGTPEVGGPSSMQALALHPRLPRPATSPAPTSSRSCPTSTAATSPRRVAATIAYEMLSLMACSEGPASERCCQMRPAARPPASCASPACS